MEIEHPLIWADFTDDAGMDTTKLRSFFTRVIASSELPKTHSENYRYGDGYGRGYGKGYGNGYGKGYSN